MSYFLQNPFMMPQTQTRSINSVNGKASVESFYLPPNSSDVFLDESQRKMFTKHVDASGVASIKVYDYTESEEEKPTEYVTKEEFEKFKATIKGVKHEPTENIRK